jgi:hypothetical protein
MARQHRNPSSVVRRLRPSPERFTAAAALQDPTLLMQLQAARSYDERPTGPPQASAPLRRRVSVAPALRGYRLAATCPAQ